MTMKTFPDLDSLPSWSHFALVWPPLCSGRSPGLDRQAHYHPLAGREQARQRIEDFQQALTLLGLCPHNISLDYLWRQRDTGLQSLSTPVSVAERDAWLGCSSRTNPPPQEADAHWPRWQPLRTSSGLPLASNAAPHNIRYCSPFDGHPRPAEPSNLEYRIHHNTDLPP